MYSCRAKAGEHLVLLILKLTGSAPDTVHLTTVVIITCTLTSLHQALKLDLVTILDRLNLLLDLWTAT